MKYVKNNLGAFPNDIINIPHQSVIS